MNDHKTAACIGIETGKRAVVDTVDITYTNVKV